MSRSNEWLAPRLRRARSWRSATPLVLRHASETRHLLLLLLVAAVIVSLSGVGGFPDRAHADVVKDCAGNRPLGQTGAWYGDLSVRNMTCRRAHRLLRTARLVDGNVRVRRFSCRLIGTYGDGGIYRCTRGGKAMRFSAGG